MKILKLLVAISMAAMITSAIAQPGGGGGQGRRGGFGMMGGRMGMGMSPAMLLGRQDVQDDLKLTAEQKTKLQSLQQEMMESNREMFASLRDMSQEERAKAIQKMNDESTKRVNAVLTPDQQKRLKEINIQMAGSQAVLMPDVSKEIALTADQSKKIQDLMSKQQEANQAIFEKMRNGEMDRSEIGPLMEKNSKILDDEIGKILTADQKDKLKAMAGKTFARRDPQRGG